MRKLLLEALAVIFVAFAVCCVIKGVSIGNFEIKNFTTIINENDELDNLIAKANTQKETTYPQALAQLQTAYKNLISEEESYQQLIELGVDEDGIPLSKIQEYEMEKIWITLGNYAKQEGVDLKIDVTINNSVSGTYDLNFTIVGEYIQIADFLYDVQRDTTLVFKIEEFKLVSAGETTVTYDDGEVETTYDLQATFVCKDIKLNIVDSSTETDSSSSIVEDDVENYVEEQ